MRGSPSRGSLLASSIAMSGVGGAPFLIQRRPISRRCRRRGRGAGDDEEAPEDVVADAAHAKNHESVVQQQDQRRGAAKTPAAAATAAPLPSRVAFCVTSAFASSISSRTSSDAFSLISATVWPICCGRLWSGSAAKVLEDQGEHEAAGERCADEGLGPLGQRDAALGHGAAGRVGAGLLAVADGGRRARGRRRASALTPADLPRRSGGKRRRRRGAVAIVASAPKPASRPDQTSRLTRSLSIAARIQSDRGRRRAPRGRRRSSRRRTSWPARTPPRPAAAASKIQPVSTCSIAP